MNRRFGDARKDGDGAHSGRQFDDRCGPSRRSIPAQPSGSKDLTCRYRCDPCRLGHCILARNHGGDGHPCGPAVGRQLGSLSCGIAICVSLKFHVTDLGRIAPLSRGLRRGALLVHGAAAAIVCEPHNSTPWDGGLNLRGAHEASARVFYGASICPIFGIARPRTRRLHVLHTLAIVQPSGSMCPFRLRASNSPCVGIRRLGAEILLMESRHTPSNGADQSKDQVRGSLAVPAFI
jgi:hypothetical protein